MEVLYAKPKGNGNGIRPLIVVGRVSTPDQARDGNLNRQTRYLRQFAHHELHRPIIAQFTYVGSARRVENRPDIRKAVALARLTGADILMLTRNRLLRNWDGRIDRDAEPDEEQWNKMNRLLRGVRVLTVLPPDAPPKEVRRFETKMSPLVGRPTLKSKRREKLKPEALALREKGWSVRRIASHLHTPRSTVQDWVAERRPGASGMGNENPVPPRTETANNDRGLSRVAPPVDSGGETLRNRIHSFPPVFTTPIPPSPSPVSVATPPVPVAIPLSASCSFSLKRGSEMVSVMVANARSEFQKAEEFAAKNNGFLEHLSYNKYRFVWWGSDPTLYRDTGVLHSLSFLISLGSKPKIVPARSTFHLDPTSWKFLKNIYVPPPVNLINTLRTLIFNLEVRELEPYAMMMEAMR